MQQAIEIWWEYIMCEGIIIAGNLIVDYVKKIDTYPKIGMLCNVMSVKRSVGGCAANTSIDIAKIDGEVPLSVLGSVGSDENGRYIIKELARNNIDVSGIIVKEDVDTSFTDVMTESDGENRTFFHARGANALFGFDDIDFGKIKADIFHIGYALLLDCFDGEDDEYGTVMAKTLAKVQGMGCKTSIDVVSENSDRYSKIVTPSLRYCNYAILNEIESSLICGIPVRNDAGEILHNNIREVCERMFYLGVKDIVCIHAPEGGWHMDNAGQYKFVPSLCLPNGYIKGSVGAGDAFCAGMLYSIYNEFDAEYSLRIAVTAAASSLSFENAIDGMVPLSKLIQLEAKYPNQTF